MRLEKDRYAFFEYRCNRLEYLLDGLLCLRDGCHGIVITVVVVRR